MKEEVRTGGGVGGELVNAVFKIWCYLMSLRSTIGVCSRPASYHSDASPLLICSRMGLVMSSLVALR